MNTTIVGLTVGWIALGLTGSGFKNAYFQRKWPQIRSNGDLYDAVTLGILFGPAALIVSLIQCRGYGWSLRKDATDVRNIRP